MTNTTIDTTRQRRYKTDVLVIGGGIAGLRAAIEAAVHHVSVTIVADNRIGYACNSAISGGGFACAADIELPGIGRDSPEKHFEDTLAAGKGINDVLMVKAMVEGIPRQKEFLQSIGMTLADPVKNEWMLGLNGTGHRYPRLCYPASLSGIEITRLLRKYAQSLNIRFLEDILITKLIVNNKMVTGALGIGKRGEPAVLASKTVVLATGGLGGIFSRNDNVSSATGDGYYLAYEAGVVLRDMEFIQFDPLGDSSGKHPLFFECLLKHPRIKLLNGELVDVVRKHCFSDAAQLTRDHLTHVMTEEIRNGLGIRGKLILDIEQLSADDIRQLAHQLPKAATRGTKRFPVAPTCHFQMGGVKSDAQCQTGLDFLYTAGEICSGVHGANRLAGNALSEALVFGYIAGRQAARRIVDTGIYDIPAGTTNEHFNELNNNFTIGEIDDWIPTWHEVKNLMWTNCGPSRHGNPLENGISKIESIHQRLKSIQVSDYKHLHTAIKVKNAAFVAEIILQACLYRCESRGAHYRRDHNHQDDSTWLCNVALHRGKQNMKLAVDTIDTNDSII